MAAKQELTCDEKDASINTGIKEYFKRGLLVHVAAVENACDAADLELENGS
jgi:hypothetical protein